MKKKVSARSFSRTSAPMAAPTSVFTFRMAALQKPAAVEVFLDAPTVPGQQLILPYCLDGDVTDLVLNVALVSKTTTTEVERVENAGRTLSHDNVERMFQSVPAVKSGQVSLGPPANYNPATGAVIAYVQSRPDGRHSGCRCGRFAIIQNRTGCKIATRCGFVLSLLTCPINSRQRHQPDVVHPEAVRPAGQ